MWCVLIYGFIILKEGWDNPNVFQVCVLQDSTNAFKRRQQIGRGLRLCVNGNGDRISDISVNTLTVVAGESFKTFANNLQNEYTTDTNINFTSVLPIKNQNNKVEIELNKRVYNGLDGNFKKLWNKINAKTIYTATLDSDALVLKVVDALKDTLNANTISVDKVNIQRNRVNIDNAGISGNLRGLSDINLNTNNDNINIVSILAESTNLTRKTIVSILQSITPEQLKLTEVNSKKFINVVEVEINNAKNNLLIDGIKYHKYNELNLYGVVDEVDHCYAQSLFDRLEHGYKDDVKNSGNVLDTNHQEVAGLQEEFKNKFLYNVLRFDSKPEVNFLRDCLARDEVKTITKLPSWFKVNTPLGKYNPDWALLVQKDGMEEVYFIAETKGESFATNGRPSEQAKVKCGKKHFVEALSVAYKDGSDARDMLNLI